MFPDLVAPFSHGVPRTKPDGTLLEYARAYKFTRAFYGLFVSTVIGVLVTLVTRPKPAEELEGLLYDSLPNAKRAYEVQRSAAQVVACQDEVVDADSGRPVIRVTEALRDALGASVGDAVLVSDRRWWYGGLRSRHATVGDTLPDQEGPALELGPDFRAMVASRGPHVVVERSG